MLAPSSFLGELIGTMSLILFGNGVVANVLLNKSKGQHGGWVVITAGWAMAVMIGVFMAQRFGSLEAHLNPAITIALMLKTGDFSNYIAYLPAQFIGAFIGASLVWVLYLPHWEITEDQANKLAVFCTAPAIRNVKANFLAEAIGTFVLIIGVNAISAAPAAGFGPYLVGMLVWGIGLSLGGATGYAINPARDLSPRIAHYLLPIAGKGDSDWNYSWIPVVAPLVGALLAMGFLNLFGF
jgi:glycerol uptake facilitator protein